MKAWGGLGAFWGGMWRLLFGSAFFIIPDVGPLLVAGPFVAMIVGALENSAVVGGLSAFGAALFSIGVPKDSVVHYESQIKAGRFVVVVHPFGGEPTKAKQILESTSHDSVTHH